jgi:hypothetical protein
MQRGNETSKRENVLMKKKKKKKKKKKRKKNKTTAPRLRASSRISLKRLVSSAWYVEE